MSNDKEYMRVYMAHRYRRRRNQAIKELGGKCVKCGTSKNLQLDHIKPETKKFAIGARLAGVSEQKFKAELAKCQLLCEECHIEKSIIERGHKIAKGTHGTVSSYRYCKCEACKAAKSEANKQYRQSRRKN